MLKNISKTIALRDADKFSTTTTYTQETFALLDIYKSTDVKYYV